MEVLEPRGGGGMNASFLDLPDRSSSLCGGLETPTPNRWLSDTVPAPLIELGQSLTEPARETTPHRALEARNVKRKASRVLGRATLDTDVEDTGKALAGLLAQVQRVYQDRLEQIQTQLAEDLESWKAEQQAQEDLLKERIATLESEVTQLRAELEQVRKATPEQTAVPQSTERGPTVPKTLRTHDQDHLRARAQDYVPGPKPVSRHNQPSSSFADIAALLATKPGGHGWQEVVHKRKQSKRTDPSKKAQPSALTPAKNAPKEARRIVFRREQSQTAPRVDKEDIILAVNRGLAQAEFPGFVRVIDAGYSSTGAVTVLLEKEALGSMLVPAYWDLVVAAARQADPAIISAELPEQWYRVKVHGVPTRRYLSCGLGLAREEIELGSRIRLKRDPTWLRRHRDMQDGSRKWSTIVVTVGSLEEARELLIHGIRFGGNRYKTEHYWEVGVDTVCPRCCRLGHRSFKACGSNPPCCFICAGPHEGHEHTCRVVECSAKAGTACQHTPAKCGNCGGPHSATAGNCPARRAARKQQRDSREAYRSDSVPSAPNRPGSPTIDLQRPTAGVRSSVASEGLAPTNRQSPADRQPRAEEAMDLSDDASEGTNATVDDQSDQ
ncbi:uncharacterized protein N7473_001868 [Penicillium subrubescens]|uniref:uncharacterized protein n=1 Tax=Penicillium subrubescens TaxID=1316194 RepID=UPI002545754B|nr:uncharacterized protein N7473_011145 [Penicillium subrubescens]XP_057011462.1 uncharacterized protein N7473_001868 [Penicillium subrubescens]KAJ5882711.1 hypothetical protein N7473_011145 [Penicillium subrubescens]KAJ5904952.1 hypothetical protein N7473_001868 [Penicillium subrubescens]